MNSEVQKRMFEGAKSRLQDTDPEWVDIVANSPRCTE